ncbi:hypothetical protein F130042H8_14500 [Enterocloster alcoholdehydrogenati]|uniref:Uncharacterized protein n=1 Tax=Enterocloster alcoholdehydrogenati TaxID=2547410 RepID=A0ABQ0AWH7_9FIRM
MEILYDLVTVNREHKDMERVSHWQTSFRKIPERAGWEGSLYVRIGKSGNLPAVGTGNHFQITSH